MVANRHVRRQNRFVWSARNRRARGDAPLAAMRMPRGVSLRCPPAGSYAREEAVVLQPPDD